MSDYLPEDAMFEHMLAITDVADPEFPSTAPVPADLAVAAALARHPADREGYGEPTEGWHWVWAPVESGPRGLHWRFVREGVEKRCRRGAGPRSHACGLPAVVELERGPRERSRWWAYCEHHMYGRRIRDGVIEEQHLEPTLQEGGPDV